MIYVFKATWASLLVLLLFSHACSPAYAAKKLMVPPVFADHMVVQRDKPIVVSGKAVAGAAVPVDVAGVVTATIPDSKGKWRVVAPAHPLGAPLPSPYRPRARP